MSETPPPQQPSPAEVLASIEGQYAVHFGGRPRITRDLNRLAEMVRGAERVAAAPTADAETRERATQRAAFYAEERGEILRAREAGGPLAWDAAWLRDDLAVEQHRYRRHFAGRSRNTRDVFLLDDLLANTRALVAAYRAVLAKGHVEGAADDLGRADEFAHMLDRERVAIEEAQAEGDAGQQAEALAQLANDQFGAYGEHFAGHPRVSRRPELLVRIIDALAHIEARMVALQQAGLAEAFHRDNIGIVRERLGAYRTELKAVREAREGASMGDIAGHLGGAANAEINGWTEHFAGRDRRGRELSRLGGMLDRLDEIERQMAAISRARQLESNEGNLAIVRDWQALMRNEFDAIDDAQREALDGPLGTA